ncbi:MAG: single-stranded DNA-binding protein [Bacteroidota bacterium]
MSVNKVVLIGNVGRDPETRYLDKDTAVSRFTLATSETYRTREGEKVTNTEWHNIVLWRGLATVAEKYVRKGSQIYIEGKIKTRSYDDKDGVKKYVTEIVADNMVLLGKRQDDDSHGSQDSYSRPAENSSRPQASPGAAHEEPEGFTPAAGEGPDDLPF